MITVVVFDAQGQKVGPFGAGPIKGIFASLLDFLMDVSTWDRFRHTARYWVAWLVPADLFVLP